MTIKTQEVEGQTRIITKEIDGDTKISCECCVAEVCCPYAADQLGIGYLEEDLPDTITINDYVDVPRTASRTGTTFQTANFQNPSFPSITTSIVLERAIDSFDDLVWQIVGINNGFPGDPVSSQPCLFYVLPETPNFYDNTVWQDDFLDTYNVSTSGGTFTVTRQSLCTWSGTDPNYNGGSTVTLKLNNASASRSRENLWTMSGAGRTDAGPYKSPVGTYGTSYVWTVSEP